MHVVFSTWYPGKLGDLGFQRYYLHKKVTQNKRYAEITKLSIILTKYVFPYRKRYTVNTVSCIKIEITPVKLQTIWDIRLKYKINSSPTLGSFRDKCMINTLLNIRLVMNSCINEPNGLNVYVIVSSIIIKLILGYIAQYSWLGWQN